jgi:hypothetical protein
MPSNSTIERAAVIGAGTKAADIAAISGAAMRAGYSAR